MRPRTWKNRNSGKQPLHDTTLTVISNLHLPNKNVVMLHGAENVRTAHPGKNKDKTVDRSK